jgi:putative inorganic carbon (hco3(-)) transporter
MHPDKKKSTSKIKGKAVSGTNNFDIYSLILLVYALAPVLTPNLGALDSSVSKFLVLAIINMAAYIFILSRKNPSTISLDHQSFFTNPIGIAYSFFLLLTLLAFTKAITVTESIVQFCQIFTIFYCTIILMMILKRDKKYFEQLSLVLTLLLVVDSITVFYGIGQYINKSIHSISEITSIYSNKNILASAIFVKIPFTLWLQMYGSKKWRVLTYAVLFISFLATFLLSSRVFYVGLGVLTLAYISFNLAKFFQHKNRFYIRNIVQFPLVLVLSLLFLIMIQFLFYPKERDSYAKNITERLGSLRSSESSVQHRLESWNIATHFIKENPVLGIGPGNWKIAEIEKEGPLTSVYKRYMIHTHNDFLEITAETGIPAGLFYILLFLLPMFYFLMTFRSPEQEQQQSYMFLPAFGILCYSFDAMINFPSGRPEIQLLFAIFLASALCFNLFQKKIQPLSKNLGRVLIILAGILTIPAVFVLYSSFISARVQRIAQEELLMGDLVHNSVFMLSAFPAFPEISVIGEPISVIKARYLIKDGKYKETISLLKNDKSSPYDGRQELMMAAAYERLANKDSVLFYAKKMLKKKPLYYEIVGKICFLEMQKGMHDSALLTMKNYLSKVDTNSAAWGYYSYMFQQSGNLARSKAVVDSALKILPKDSLLTVRKNYIDKLLLESSNK